MILLLSQALLESGRTRMDIIHEEIDRQIWYHNLSYLLLAQRLLNHYENSALFRLGIDKCTGDKLRHLSLPELIRLAERPELITVLRLRDHHQIDVLLSQASGMR